MFSMKSWDIFRTGLWRQNQLFQVKTGSPPHPNQVFFIPKANKQCCHNVKMKLNLKLQHKTDFKLKHIRGFTENLSQKAGSDQLWVLFYMKIYFVQIHKRKMCTPLPLQSLNYWNTTLAMTLCSSWFFWSQETIKMSKKFDPNKMKSKHATTWRCLPKSPFSVVI